ETAHDKCEGAEQAHRSGAEHGRLVAATVAGGRPGRRPRQPLLHIPHLDQRLFSNRQRLDQDSDISQVRWHNVHGLLSVDNQLRHETVVTFDAALCKVTGETKVLSAGPARPARFMQTWPPYHGDDDVARLDASDRAAGAYNLAQGFVPDYQIRRAVGRHTVVEAADLLIGAAHADVEHVQQHVGVVLEHRFSVVFDHFDTLIIRKYRDSSHRSPLSSGLSASLYPSA